MIFTKKYSSLFVFIVALIFITNCQQEKAGEKSKSINNSAQSDTLDVLFGEVAVESENWQPEEEYEIRGRYVSPDLQIFSGSDEQKEGREFLLNLFEDKTYMVAISRDETGPGEIRMLTGRVVNSKSGYVSITIEDGKLFGTVRIPSEKRLFLITHRKSSGMHAVAEVDEDKMGVLPGGDPLYMENSNENK